MIRRQARQRRDYLHRRALAAQDAETAARRAQLKAALASGQALPPSIAKDKQLRADFAYDETQPDEAGSAAALAELDDEYAHLSGVSDPRVVVTTSRNPSSRLAAFAKEMRLIFPTAVRVNRGTTVLGELAGAARAAGLSDVLLLHEHRGTPSALTVSHLPHGPTASFSLHAVALRHDLPAAAKGAVPESYPHLILEGFESPLGKRVARILCHLFPPRDAVGPRSPASKLGSRVVTFVNREDFVEMRHHVFVATGPGQVELAEIGPRMTLRLFEIRAGALDNASADVEWRLSHYTRTARKKDYL